MLIKELFINFEHKYGAGGYKIYEYDIGVFAEDHIELFVDLMTEEFAYVLFFDEAVEDGLVGVDHEEGALDLVLFPLA